MELRRLFNDGRYQERAACGELSVSVKTETHPTSPRAPVPYCTLSQLLAYTNQRGLVVALAHQYLKPDGTIGASGRPDPKHLYENGILYRLAVH